MKLPSKVFLQTVEKNLLSSVTFPAFLLLIIIFVFTLHLFDFSAPFQACSLTFRPTSIYLMSSYQDKAVYLDILTQFS